MSKGFLRVACSVMSTQKIGFLAHKKEEATHAPLPSFDSGARIRTWEWRYQKPLPYRLATPDYVSLKGSSPPGKWCFKDFYRGCQALLARFFAARKAAPQPLEITRNTHPRIASCSWRYLHNSQRKRSPSCSGCGKRC